MPRSILFALAFFSVFDPLTAREAVAGPVCDTREEMLKQIEGKYGEAAIGAGLERRGSLVTIYTAGDNSTWSILVSDPTGMMCLVAAGEGWVEMSAPPIPPLKPGESDS